jgi:hypothetical protein
VGVTVIVTGVIVTVELMLCKLLNPAVAFTNNVRFDVGTYRNPLGASIVNVAVPFPVVNGNQSELAFEARLMIGNVLKRISGAFTVTVYAGSVPPGGSPPPPPPPPIPPLPMLILNDRL